MTFTHTGHFLGAGSETPKDGCLPAPQPNLPAVLILEGCKRDTHKGACLQPLKMPLASGPAPRGSPSPAKAPTNRPSDSPGLYSSKPVGNRGNCPELAQAQAKAQNQQMLPFWCYYGGKWRMGPCYPEPTEALLIEPFAGAANYSVRYADRQVVLVEKNPAIAALWRYLLRVSPAELDRLPLLEPGQTVRDLQLSPEPALLIGFWVNKGVASARNSQSAWMRSGIRPGSFWGAKVRSRLAAQVERIQHWQVFEGCYSRLPNVRATWFIDPPYQGRPGLQYPNGSSAIDYTQLAEFCRSRQGQTIVCEAQGADWLPFQPLGSFKSNNARKRSAEAVWLGGA